jgi:dipeptidyl aminopeptidase/acylaminoacyl peptidase
MNLRWTHLAALVIAAATLTAHAAEEPEIISRRVLFGNPDKAAARISPDGKYISYLGPVDGVLNVWVGPVADPQAAQPVTKDTKRGIRSYFWAYTSRHILYRQDVGGDEDWHVYSTEVTTKETKDLTPLEKVSAQIQEVSHRHPAQILVGLNDRDPQLHDVHRIDIRTGERELVLKNPGFSDFITDEDLKVRFGIKFTEDGGNLVQKPDGNSGWTDFLKVPMQDTLTTTPVGFDKSGQTLYLMDSRGRDTGALAALDIASGKSKVVASSDLADVDGILSHPTENTILAASFTYLRKDWQVLDPSVKADFEYLRTVADGELEITSQTLDNQQWSVAYLMDNGPVRYYRYDRSARKAHFLFTNREDLEGVKLARMHPVVVPARDGMKLVSYLTLPLGSDSATEARPAKPLPMVLLVHGGPWARDQWGYDAEHQFLANRGYAVLSVNFRGSTGFGKEYVNAGNRQWAAKMHDDLLDAVQWAVKEKIADPQRVGIMGASYGGYATLVALTFTPDVFACGVDIVGPSNILTLLSTIPAYWQPAVQMFRDRVGDFTSEEGKKFLEERSPLGLADRIRRPLLIGQGANDPRVKQSEADQIVAAMQKHEIPVTYVVYPDEGHGFARPENRLSFYAVTEAFLSQHLGGRHEPIGDAFEDSSITVPTGAEGVPGLKAALR